MAEGACAVCSRTAPCVGRQGGGLPVAEPDYVNLPNLLAPELQRPCAITRQTRVGRRRMHPYGCQGTLVAKSGTIGRGQAQAPNARRSGGVSKERPDT